jgi:hypothetical protein
MKIEEGSPIIDFIKSMKKLTRIDNLVDFYRGVYPR